MQNAPTTAMSVAPQESIRSKIGRTFDALGTLETRLHTMEEFLGMTPPPSSQQPTPDKPLTNLGEVGRALENLIEKIDLQSDIVAHISDELAVLQS